MNGLTDCVECELSPYQPFDRIVFISLSDKTAVMQNLFYVLKGAGLLRMYEFLISLVSGITVYLITKHFDIELYAKSLYFFPKRKVIEIKWSKGRKLVTRSSSEFLVADLKSSIFISFVISFLLLICMWMMFFYMDFDNVSSDSPLTPEQTKSVFGLFTISYSLCVPFITISDSNKYQLVRGHYLNKLKAGQRNAAYSSKLLRNGDELMRKKLQ